MLSQNQILFGNKRLQEVAISWDVPILKAARILASKELDEFWKWINADAFLNYQLNETQNLFEKEKKQYAEDCKNHERPWELWQYAVKSRDVLDWCDLSSAPIWNDPLVYRRKQIEFVPEYYSGLNCKDAEHLIGKVVEGTNYPNEDWKTVKLINITNGKQRSGVFEVYHQKEPGVIGTYEYIRTVEEILVPEHPTINIGGTELPKPETVAPAVGTKYWVSPTCAEMYWHEYYYNMSALNSGRVHLTKERAQAWADWWKTTVIDKMK